ncbi:reverse transcriptase domain-containing protein [Tanacetum coccineum]
MIGSILTEEGRNKLCGLLQRNLDIFAWKPTDMTGVPRHIAKHRLNVREGCSPVRQKKSGQAANRNQAIQEKIGKLVEAGIIKRRDILRIKSQHQEAESMSRHGGRCLKYSISKMLERRTKVKQKTRKPEQKSNFHWNAEVEEAFKQIKQLIAELPMLTAPMEKEQLILYLAATKKTVSAVLMKEREAKQMLIYFVSRALRGVIKTGSNREATEMEHRIRRIHYRPRVSVKGQILVDFIVERQEEDSLDTLMEVEEELPEPWILFIDGSSCTDGSGAGLILINPEGIEFTYALRFRFISTNNEAEYEALIARLRIAEQMGVKNLQANVDSQLVDNQVTKRTLQKKLT